MFEGFALTRFALERLPYRLSISAHRERFPLKGALLFDLWFDEPHRPTRDADFLGCGPAVLPTMEATFREPEFRVSPGLCWRNPDQGAARASYCLAMFFPSIWIFGFWCTGGRIAGLRSTRLGEVACPPASFRACMAAQHTAPPLPANCCAAACIRMSGLLY
jgi:hypothetical protein